MAYSTTNPPHLLSQAIAATRLWVYVSADAAAVVDAAGYFTNGFDLGMRQNDQIIVYNRAGNITTWHRVIVEAGNVIDLGDGTTVGSATDTD
jgi:archaeosine-15-forming tRNA-guanine transglycosylase